MAWTMVDSPGSATCVPTVSRAPDGVEQIAGRTGEDDVGSAAGGIGSTLDGDSDICSRKRRSVVGTCDGSGISCVAQCEAAGTAPSPVIAHRWWRPWSRLTISYLFRLSRSAH